MATVDNRAVKIDRILSRAIATMQGNPLVVFGLALVFAGLPSVVINGVTQRMRMPPQQMTGANFAGYMTVAFVTAAVVLLLYILAQGALVRATIAQAEGRRATFGECAAVGLRAALPLIALNILLFLAVVFASLLLLVPGIFLFVLWSAASPALVAERCGVFGAFARSAALTRGARWKVFGVELIAIVFVWVISGALGIVMVAIEGVAGFAAMSRTGLPLWYLLVSAIIQTLVVALWGTIQTSLYIELRDWKDGPAGAALADVFA